MFRWAETVLKEVAMRMMELELLALRCGEARRSDCVVGTNRADC
jgi:hypothetical protein